MNFPFFLNYQAVANSVGRPVKDTPQSLYVFNDCCIQRRSKFSRVTPCRIQWKVAHLYPREHLALSQLLYVPIHRDLQPPGRLNFLIGRVPPLFYNTQSLFELSVGDCVTRTVVQHLLDWNYRPGGFLWPNPIHRNDNNQTPIVPADTRTHQLTSATLDGIAYECEIDGPTVRDAFRPSRKAL